MIIIIPWLWLPCYLENGSTGQLLIWLLNGAFWWPFRKMFQYFNVVLSVGYVIQYFCPDSLEKRGDLSLLTNLQIKCKWSKKISNNQNKTIRKSFSSKFVHTSINSPISLPFPTISLKIQKTILVDLHSLFSHLSRSSQSQVFKNLLLLNYRSGIP